MLIERKGGGKRPGGQQGLLFPCDKVSTFCAVVIGGKGSILQSFFTTVAL